MRQSLIVLVLFLALSVGAVPKTYYVSNSGSSGNDGLTTSTPLDLATVTSGSKLEPGDVVLVMDGTFTDVTFTIRDTNCTFRSLHKWGAKIHNSTGNGISAFSGSLATLHDVTIEGFEIEAPAGHGIYLQADSNCVVRDCWIAVASTSGIHSGISAVEGTAGQEGTLNMLFERNLVEGVGNAGEAKFCHGFYLAGTNITVRDCVVRYCTGNGIQINDNTNLLGSRGVDIHGNLCYNNARAQIILSSALGSVTATLYGNTCFNQTNYVIANSNTNTAVGINVPNGTCTLTLSNNILIGGGGTLYENTGTIVATGDYNVFMRTDNLPAGAHNIQVANANGMFVNTNAGLFWLATGGTAIGAALSAIAAPNNFWGVPQTGVSDIGAFQYNATYAADSRTLDPSGSAPDYWQFLIPQTHYLSTSSGSDLNDGLSIATAWAHHPDSAEFTGWATSRFPGDQFIFKGGDEWDAGNFPLVISSGGTLAAHVSYRTNGSWGTDRAIFDGGYTANGIIYVGNGTAPNCDWVGIEMRHVLNVENFGPGIFSGANVSGEFITNGWLHGWRLLNTITTDDAHGGLVMQFDPGYGITNLIADHTKIDNSENGPSGLWNGVCARMWGEFNHCEICSNSSGILFAQDVNHSVVHDIHYPYNGFDESYHFNGFYMDYGNGNADPGDTVIYFRNSGFYNTGGGANMAYPNVEAYNCKIFNSLFYGQMSDQQAINIDTFDFGFSGVMNDCEIYNNTIVLPNPAWNTGIRVASRPGLSVNNFFVTNNLIIGQGAAIAPFHGPTFFIANEQVGNNIALTPGAASADGYTLADLYQPTSAFDPTVNTGANLAGLGLYSADYYGNAYPADGAGVWDIGYAKWLTPPSPSPFQGVTIISRAGAPVTITGKQSAPITLTGK